MVIESRESKLSVHLDDHHHHDDDLKYSNLNTNNSYITIQFLITFII